MPSPQESAEEKKCQKIEYRRWYTRREFLREILYKNIAIIAIQHSNMYFVDTSGDFSHTKFPYTY